MAGIYKRNFALHRCYKDGFRLQSAGISSINPYPLTSQEYFAWQDGWNARNLNVIPIRFAMNFNTALTETDPGLGMAGFNSLVPDTVGSVRLSFTSSGGSNVTEALRLVSIGKTIVIQSREIIDNFTIHTVNAISMTTYATFTVSTGYSGNLFTSNMPLIVELRV